MEKDDIFRNMRFDFNKPVIVTISFEDSDDEEKSAVIKKEQESIYENHIENHTINQTKECLKESNTRPADKAINSNGLENENVNKDCTSDRDLLGTSNQYCSNQVNNKDNDINFDKSNKRKTEVEQKDTNAKKNKIVQSNENFSDIMLSEQQNNQIHPLQYQQNSVAISVITENKSSDSLSTNKQVNEDCNMEFYFTNLLNTVSEHIILIIDGYQFYHRIANTNKNAMDHFVRMKDQIFNLSYSTLVNILLPQENNRNFVTKFVHDTIKISGNKYSFVQISDVVREMLQWAKSKKQVISTLPMQFQAGNNPQPYNNYLLTHHLRQPPTSRTDHNINGATAPNTSTFIPSPHYLPPSQSISPNQRTQQLDQKADKACIFTSGPPGRQISINVNPVLLNPQSGAPSTLNNSNPVTTLAQDRSYKVAVYQDTQSAQPSEPPQWIIQNNFYDRTLQTQNDQRLYPLQPHLPNGTSHQTHYSQFPVVSNYHAIQHPANMHLAAPPPAVEAPPARVAPPPRLPPPPPYPTYQRSHKIQSTMSQNNIEKKPAQIFQSEASDQKAQAENTRSLSTDSGIMSPLHFNISDPTTNANTKEENDALALLITHVTSLNPNAAYIEEGACTVCKRVTKKKCLGCLKLYYCSYLCQRDDWTLHKFACTPSRT